MAYFKSISLSGINQFEKVDISFHDRVTILTGANGAGKTTILNIISKHFGWDMKLVSTPKKTQDNKNIRSWVVNLFSPKSQSDSGSVVGQISYPQGSDCIITIPNGTGATYNFSFENQQGVNGFFIPSHKIPFFYRPMANLLSVKSATTHNAFQGVNQQTKNLWQGGGSNSDTTLYIKQTLIARNIYGHGNPNMSGNEDLLQLFISFEDLLSKILPTSFGFKNIEIRNDEIVLITSSGDFPIDGVSGGISSIIQIGWEIFNFYENIGHQKCVVVIDEIENHLHPVLQREILPNLVNSFLNIQFIISTHSPLVVSSVKDSRIYALKFNERNKIISKEISFSKDLKNATEILDEVLGVSFTLPIWIEDDLQKIINKYSAKELNTNLLTGLKDELKTLGLGNYFPDATLSILNNRND